MTGPEVDMCGFLRRSIESQGKGDKQVKELRPKMLNGSVVWTLKPSMEALLEMEMETVNQSPKSLMNE